MNTSYGGLGQVVFYKGKPYWMTEQGLVTSSDTGKNWDLVGDVLPSYGEAGPYFGKDEKHIIMAAYDYFVETVDGGNTWYELAAYPFNFAPVTWPYQPISEYHFGYDAEHDVLYAANNDPSHPLGIFKLTLNRLQFTGVQKEEIKSAQKIVLDNYPNPFNLSTEIRFSLPEGAVPASYGLKVYNLRGQLVRTLVKGMTSTAQTGHCIVWNAKDEQGRTVEKGMYVYRLKVGTRVTAGNMVFAK
jgi:hypothetical protein